MQPNPLDSIRKPWGGRGHLLPMGLPQRPADFLHYTPVYSPDWTWRTDSSGLHMKDPSTSVRAEWPLATAVRLQAQVSMSSIFSDHGRNPHPNVSTWGSSMTSAVTHFQPNTHLRCLSLLYLLLRIKTIKMWGGGKNASNRKCMSSSSGNVFGLGEQARLWKASQHRELLEVPQQVGEMWWLCFRTGCPATVTHTVEAMGHIRERKFDKVPGVPSTHKSLAQRQGHQPCLVGKYDIVGSWDSHLHGFTQEHSDLTLNESSSTRGYPDPQGTLVEVWRHLWLSFELLSSGGDGLAHPFSNCPRCICKMVSWGIQDSLQVFFLLQSQLASLMVMGIQHYTHHYFILYQKG